MGLVLRRQRDGRLRPYWYAKFEDNGCWRVVNLGVRWRGAPPMSGHVSDVGDPAFERTREEAQRRLDELLEEVRQKGRAEHLTQRLIEAKTGRRVEHVRLDQLADLWRSIPRPSVNPHYLAACDAHFRAFVDFMRERRPRVRFLYEVTAEDVAAFIKDTAAKVAPTTLRHRLTTLSSAARRFLPIGAANPFALTTGRRLKTDAGIEHRRPFTPEQLHALLEAARGDALMFPLIVCAACTGARRGDVCRLRWRDVDLVAGMVRTKAAKTGAEVEIPIFPPLRAVLEECLRKTPDPHPDAYVFPEAARMYETNPDGLTLRFKRIVARALASDTEQSDHAPTVPASRIAAEGAAAIRAHVPEGPRRDRMLEVWRRYTAGESVRQIERATGIARPTVAQDLHTLEMWTGKRFVRAPPSAGPRLRQAVASITRTPRARGQRAASVYDWHSLRVTWITSALAAGVPMEIVRRVTGHQTVDVVLKHYFRPGREHFREVLARALPDPIAGPKNATPSPAEELAALAAKVAAGTATDADKARLRALARKV